MLLPPKILVVDDEPLTCQLIAKVLTLNGYEAAVLSDAQRIFDVVETVAPDLILLDYHLGVRHGLEILHQLKESPQFRDIPVVMTSGLDRRKEILEAGAADFLLKPFDWNELTVVVGNALNFSKV